MATSTLARSASSRRWSRLIIRILKLLVVAAAGVLAAGAAYQFIQVRLDARRFPMPGKLVDVGGTALHIHCAGTGSPTVLFDAGLGDSSATWDLVLPEIAKFTRACAYDRAGYGWSEAPNEPRTTANIAAELDRLLTRSGIAGPLVLVGHSFGGFNIRAFQARHPSQVVGMVFVDSSHPEQVHRLPGSSQADLFIGHYEHGAWLMLIGVPRALGWCRDDYTFPNEPVAWKPIAPEAIALDCHRLTWQTEAAELRLFRSNGDAVAKIGPLGSLPIVVLSHDPAMGAGFPASDAAAAERTWTAMQEELRGLSTDSKRIVAKGSGHYIEVYRPELVIQAIREIVEASNAGTRIDSSLQAAER